jgi:hypothetical protein
MEVGNKNGEKEKRNWSRPEGGGREMDDKGVIYERNRIEKWIDLQIKEERSVKCMWLGR